jgi:hypothetical protein
LVFLGQLLKEKAVLLTMAIVCFGYSLRRILVRRLGRCQTGAAELKEKQVGCHFLFSKERDHLVLHTFLDVFQKKNLSRVFTEA